MVLYSRPTTAYEFNFTYDKEIFYSCMGKIWVSGGFNDNNSSLEQSFLKILGKIYIYKKKYLLRF